VYYVSMRQPTKFTRLYSPGEVAKLANVSRRTLYRWIESGFLPAIKYSTSDAWGISEETVAALLSGELRGRRLLPVVQDEPESASKVPAKSKVRPSKSGRRK